MKLYEISYTDGNKRLLESENIVMLMKCLINENKSKNIYKIKEKTLDKQ